MDEVKTALKHEVGPLAVWQWIVVAVAGVALGYAIRRWFPTETDADQEGEDAAGIGSGGGLVGPVGTVDGVDPSAGQVTITTNEQWLDYAAATLRATTQFSAVDIDTALRRYLAGEPLNATHVAVIEQALRQAGSPPMGAPSIIREVPTDEGDTGTPQQPATPPAGYNPAPPTSDPVTYIATGAGSGTTEAQRQAAIASAGSTPVYTSDGPDPDSEPDRLVLVAGMSARAPAPGQTQAQERGLQLHQLELKQRYADDSIKDNYAPAIEKVQQQLVALAGGKTEAQLRAELQQARRNRDGDSIKAINAMIRAVKRAS